MLGLSFHGRSDRQGICVINDPLGQTQSPTSSDHYSDLTFGLVCEILKKDDLPDKPANGRTDTTYENSDHYLQLLWVGLVDLVGKVAKQGQRFMKGHSEKRHFRFNCSFHKWTNGCHLCNFPFTLDPLLFFSCSLPHWQENLTPTDYHMTYVKEIIISYKLLYKNG